ncbi:mediator of RNA polymerase II transcription subunit 16-like [Dorcoceras hygrometricum]|uniref:Mediator of RNA polymerase II transcription subunit 16-like n=1 Tax=Dorcoceras hygrometricum TaxID=472368 RepID=A0A2Z7CZH1_9LAMI|nr:mediator of RNA polymerase II transcription subunit 16-like [Dorcoceras hygrometricum]
MEVQNQVQPTAGRVFNLYRKRCLLYNLPQMPQQSNHQRFKPRGKQFKKRSNSSSSGSSDVILIRTRVGLEIRSELALAEPPFGAILVALSSSSLWNSIDTSSETRVVGIEEREVVAVLVYLRDCGPVVLLFFCSFGPIKDRIARPPSQLANQSVETIYHAQQVSRWKSSVRDLQKPSAHHSSMVFRHDKSVGHHSYDSVGLFRHNKSVGQSQRGSQSEFKLFEFRFELILRFLSRFELIVASVEFAVKLLG